MVSLVLPEITELVVRRESAQIRSALEDWHVVDLAELLDAMDDPDHRREFFRVWGPDDALGLFGELEVLDRVGLLATLGPEERRFIVNAMSPDDRADVFAELEEEYRAPLMELLEPETRSETDQLLQYAPDTAGGLMTTEFVAVPMHITSDEAVTRVREAAQTAETIYTVYVVNESDKLVGVISLRELMLSMAEAPLSEIMITPVVSAAVDEDQEDTANRLRSYDLTAIPVVGDDDRLVGIVTVDDVLDVLDEESAEDAYRMAAIREYETSYLDTPAWKLAWQRSAWLLVLVLAGFLSGFVLESYMGLLGAFVALTIFIPVLTGSGGNAGIQVSTTIVRCLATGELAPGDALKVLRKELAAGTIVGLVMGALAAGRAAFVDVSPSMIATVGLSMTTVVVAAVAIGGMLPLGLKRLGLDPALMSSPLITTVTDSLALLIFLGAATWLLMM
jgi:magnesium transporter